MYRSFLVTRYGICPFLFTSNLFISVQPFAFDRTLMTDVSLRMLYIYSSEDFSLAFFPLLA